ncbi:MAG: type II CAAX endopeptidase family protein [Gammaproteobacteria bacterium]|nr:type II CAAX endopeptidase family protein [Gammaproteobacteria bacterium]
MSFEFTARQNKFGALLAFGFFLIYVASMAVGSSIGAAVYSGVYATGDSSSIVYSSAEVRVMSAVFQHIAGAIVGGVVIFALIVICIRRMPQAVSFAEFGFVRSSLWKCVAAFVVGLSLNLFFMLELRELFPFDGERRPGSLEGINDVAEKFRVMAAFGMVVMAPLNEEMLFRGVLYSGFTKAVGRFSAAVLVTCLFASIHFSVIASGYWLDIPVLFFISSLLILVRVLSGSLYPAMSLHAGFNSALIFPVQMFAG